MKLIDRLKAPTPKFYKILRNVGLGMAAAGGVLIASPIAIPAIFITIGGYLIVAGSVATAISQSVTTTEGDASTHFDKLSGVSSATNKKNN